MYTAYEKELTIERIQILLEPVDWDPLKQLAQEAHTSMSQIVRDLLRERVRQQRRANMRKAAELMADTYRTDLELTALTILDNKDARQ